MQPSRCPDRVLLYNWLVTVDGPIIAAKLPPPTGIERTGPPQPGLGHEILVRALMGSGPLPTLLRDAFFAKSKAKYLCTKPAK
jgi:hypothetical protein